MSITRDVPRVVHALDQKVVYNCSTGDVFASSAINGDVIDRRGLARHYQAALPFGTVYTTWGSTALDRKLTMAVKLQHGDSSAGGDATDYSTGSQPPDRIIWTTAQTTTYESWTTGVLKAETLGGVYDLRAAKRYVRSVITLTSTAVVSTSTVTPAETYRVQGGVVFKAGDEQPGRSPLPSGLYSTSTSTST